MCIRDREYHNGNGHSGHKDGPSLFHGQGQQITADDTGPLHDEEAGQEAVYTLGSRQCLEEQGLSKLIGVFRNHTCCTLPN